MEITKDIRVKMVVADNNMSEEELENLLYDTLWNRLCNVVESPYIYIEY